MDALLLSAWDSEQLAAIRWLSAWTDVEWSAANRCWHGLVVNTLCLINVVALHRARLVPGWVTQSLDG